MWTSTKMEKTTYKALAEYCRAHGLKIQHKLSEIVAEWLLEEAGGVKVE